MDINTVISVIVPLNQDDLILGDIIEELDNVMSHAYKYYEIIIVDDGSIGQRSVQLSKILQSVNKVRYIRLSRPFGRTIANAAGIESAIGDFVVTFDPYCDPIDEIPRMIAYCQNSEGIVQGLASNPHIRNFIRELGGKWFRRYCKRRLAIDIRKGAEDFRVMSRQAVNALLQIREQRRHPRVLTLLLGYGNKYYTYSRKPRKGEIDHRTFKGDFMSAISVTIAYSSHPLHFISLCGFIIIIACFCFPFLIALSSYNHMITVNGLLLISIQLCLVPCVLCLMISLVGEYVIAVRNDLKPRPLYFIEKDESSSVVLENTVMSSIVNNSIPTNNSIQP